MIVHDFAYADLGFDGYRPPSILQVPGAKELAVEIYSLSKSFNMAGWRVGFCLGNAKLINALPALRAISITGFSSRSRLLPSSRCASAADDRKDPATYQTAPGCSGEGLDRAGWPVDSPRGTMFVWAPIPEPHRAAGSLEFAKLLMEKALVAVSPGIGFGPMGEGHVRFGLIENEHRIRQAAKSIQGFLKNEL